MPSLARSNQVEHGAYAHYTPTYIYDNSYNLDANDWAISLRVHDDHEFPRAALSSPSQMIEDRTCPRTELVRGQNLSIHKYCLHAIIIVVTVLYQLSNPLASFYSLLAYANPNELYAAGTMRKLRLLKMKKNKAVCWALEPA